MTAWTSLSAMVSRATSLVVQRFSEPGTGCVGPNAERACGHEAHDAFAHRPLVHLGERGGRHLRVADARPRRRIAISPAAFAAIAATLPCDVKVDPAVRTQRRLFHLA